jgi:hypothetical protein
MKSTCILFWDVIDDIITKQNIFNDGFGDMHANDKILKNS